MRPALARKNVDLKLKALLQGLNSLRAERSRSSIGREIATAPSVKYPPDVKSL